MAPNAFIRDARKKAVDRRLMGVVHHLPGTGVGGGWEVAGGGNLINAAERSSSRSLPLLNHGQLPPEFDTRAGEG